MTSASWSAVAEGQYERIVGYFIAKKYVDYKIHVLRGAAYRSAQSVGCRPRWPLASAKFEPTRDATRSRQPPSECAAGARTWGRTATVGFGFNFERPYWSDALPKDRTDWMKDSLSSSQSPSSGLQAMPGAATMNSLVISPHHARIA